MSKNDQINKRLEAMRKKENESQPTKVIDKIVNQEEVKPDLKKIAQELQERHQKEAVSANSGFIKDTLYIEEDVYRAFNALCVKRGEKKTRVNEALREYVEKEYKKIKKQGN